MCKRGYPRIQTEMSPKTGIQIVAFTSLMSQKKESTQIQESIKAMRTINH